MSEEMKMILALAEHLGLDVYCSGVDVDDELVSEECFGRNMSQNYRYTIRPKP